MYQDRLRSVESLVGRTVPFILVKENEKRKRTTSNGAFRKMPALDENLITCELVISIVMENIHECI